MQICWRHSLSHTGRESSRYLVSWDSSGASTDKVSPDRNVTGTGSRRRRGRGLACGGWGRGSGRGTGAGGGAGGRRSCGLGCGCDLGTPRRRAGSRLGGGENLKTSGISIMPSSFRKILTWRVWAYLRSETRTWRYGDMKARRAWLKSGASLLN